MHRRAQAQSGLAQDRAQISHSRYGVVTFCFDTEASFGPLVAPTLAGWLAAWRAWQRRKRRRGANASPWRREQRGFEGSKLEGPAGLAAAGRAWALDGDPASRLYDWF